MRNIRLTHIFFLGALFTAYAIASGVGESLNTSRAELKARFRLASCVQSNGRTGLAPTSLSRRLLRYKIKMIKATI
jgi:hypothetical protein